MSLLVDFRHRRSCSCSPAPGSSPQPPVSIPFVPDPRRPDLRRSPRRRLARRGSRDASLALYLWLGVARRADLRRRRPRLERAHRRDGGLHRRLRRSRRRLPATLAERGWDRRFSSAVGAMLTGNVIIYAGRAALARGRAEHEPGADARIRPLQVRPRRPAEAVPRRRASAGGVARSSSECARS